MNAATGAVWLQAEPSAFDPSFYLMLGSIFMIFYFLVLRPDSKRRKAQENSVKGAEKGDTIVTSGGMQGKVTGATDDVLTVEIAVLKSGERVRIKLQRSGIQSVTKAGAGSDGKEGKTGKSKKGGDS